MKLVRRFLLSAVLGLGTLVAGCSLAAASERDAIREQFVNHRALIQSGQAKWRMTLLPVAPTDPPAYQIRECSLAFDNDRQRFDARSFGPGVFKQNSHQAMTFDGKKTRILMWVDHGRIFAGDERRQFDAPDELFAHQGYPTTAYTIRYEGGSASCDVASLLATDDYQVDGKQTLQGVECVVVAGPGDRLWFDPRRGYALVQRELSDKQNGHVQLRHSMADFKEEQPNFWLAHRIDGFLDFRDQPRTHTRLVVTLLDWSLPAEEDFVLVFGPKTDLEDASEFAPNSDGTLPVAVYRVPVDPGQLDTVAAAAIERVRTRQLERASGHALKWVLFASTSVVVVALGYWLVRRRLRLSDTI